MSRLSAITEEIAEALRDAQDDVIAATVCEDKNWRAESFIDAMRHFRHLHQLGEELTRLAAEEAAAAGAARDLETLRQAAAQKAGAQ